MLRFAADGASFSHLEGHKQAAEIGLLQAFLATGRAAVISA
jgi:hypothetical protein